MLKINRRDVVKLGFIAGGSLLLPIALQLRSQAQNAGSPRVTPFSVPFRVPPVLNPVRSDSTTDYYEITIKKANLEILPGLQTQIWGYNGIAPGPTIKQHVSRRSVIRFINDVGTNTVVHLHGMPSLPQYDGYAEDFIPHGYYKDYIYPNNRIAATLWYHDHTVMVTAQQAYMGLAGMYILQDDLELGLPLPKGEYDVPLFLSDKIFASDGSLVFNDQNRNKLMGDVITVNGVPWPRMEVANCKYRFRMLNGSVSRSYKPSLNTGDDLIMIATDGGLLSAPVRVKNFRLGMGERYEFIIDFSQYPIGTSVILQNESLPNNDDYDNTDKIMRFDVVRSVVDNSSIPNQMRNIPSVSQLVAQAVRTREWHYDKFSGVWVINGKEWDKDRVDANPRLGEYEIWSLNNVHQDWFHTIHIHLIDCLIIDRNRQAAFPYERGWKDVFYVGENENVRVVGKFDPNKGKYMTHCHNLVHEDHDMMTQLEVDQGGISPFAAPAQLLPAPPL
ncbi:multicopper oxidase family protein [Iningainema tapete]|uniref:Multicopper oxidase family protein n=1 Tax=Iningainema tapete BLCC-T55 TaxID=2748662 RepID=A0A8J7BYF7_9CYAN|nr:multicopper oxidase family protein [Iningainema tapete]MBD2774048.1 multicopper oxidase family protein [Iningainema tapete BLCC-T55]